MREERQWIGRALGWATAVTIMTTGLALGQVGEAPTAPPETAGGPPAAAGTPAAPVEGTLTPPVPGAVPASSAALPAPQPAAADAPAVENCPNCGQPPCTSLCELSKAIYALGRPTQFLPSPSGW